MKKEELSNIEAMCFMGSTQAENAMKIDHLPCARFCAGFGG